MVRKCTVLRSNKECQSVNRPLATNKPSYSNNNIISLFVLKSDE